MKFLKLKTQAQYPETVVQGRSLPPIPASGYSSPIINFIQRLAIIVF
ncbi:MAG: hypothetical protein LBJ00_16920 [Planctomycetaceae bacterium]|nr:hypothetical protein [Planctomycetaceae bacterium]